MPSFSHRGTTRGSSATNHMSGWTSRVVISTASKQNRRNAQKEEIHMESTLKLMAILAHPDDESLGNGGMLAKYAAEGIEIHLLVATRGEHGWFGKESEYPGLEALGAVREAEVRAAAAVLGLHSVQFLNYIDGELDAAHPAEITAKIVGHLRRVRPDVVVTFGPYGGYGHPDHIAISQFTPAAIVEAANPNSLYSRYLARLVGHSQDRYLEVLAYCRSCNRLSSDTGARLSCTRAALAGAARNAVGHPELLSRL